MSEYTQGYVTIDGRCYQAEQGPPDGNFRKRSTRYWKNGKRTDWCKDDHDLFTPFTYAYGVRTDITSPRLGIERRPVRQYKKGGRLSSPFAGFQFAQKSADTTWFGTFAEALAESQRVALARAEWMETEARAARAQLAVLLNPAIDEAAYFASPAVPE